MMQDHIHLAMTLGIAPEYSPIYTWKIVFPEYIEVPEVVLSTKRTTSGRLRWHVLHDVSGPIQFMNYQLTLKLYNDSSVVTRQQLGYLLAMNGQQVKYVDLDHIANGSDHTPYVKAMRLQVAKVHPITPALNYYLIDVDLTDDNRV
jgi:hypothetical protein